MGDTRRRGLRRTALDVALIGGVTVGPAAWVFCGADRYRTWAAQALRDGGPALDLLRRLSRTAELLAHAVGEEWSRDLKGTDLRDLRITPETGPFRNAILEDADLTAARFDGVDLSGSLITRAALVDATFVGCDLNRVQLCDGDLRGAHLRDCTLRWADLRGADLEGATFDSCDLRSADLTGAKLAGSRFRSCRVFGINLWGTSGEPNEASTLRLAPSDGQVEIEIDGLHISVFVDSLWRGNGVRDLVDGLTSTVVLLLGRFDPANKVVLDRLRDELRVRGYSAMLFDTTPAVSRDLSETVQVLARLSRFVIADLSDPRSSPHELQQFVPFVAVPTATVTRGQPSFSMAGDNEKYSWVLPHRTYADQDLLFSDLDGLLEALEEARGRALIDRTARASISNPA